MSIVSSKGQIVIPKEIREALGVKPGMKVMFKVVKNHAEIIPVPTDPVNSFCGVFEKGPSLTSSLLKTRKEEAKLEKQATT